MEYYCPYCKEWNDAALCKPHFEHMHDQKDVTIEKLQERTKFLGGVTTREGPPPTDDDGEDKILFGPEFIARNYEKKKE